MVLTMGLKQYILGVLQCSEGLLSCESYPVIPFGPMHQIITFGFLVSGPGTLTGGAKILELKLYIFCHCGQQKLTLVFGELVSFLVSLALFPQRGSSSWL